MAERKEVKPVSNKTTNTAFILLFPSLILAGMAVYFATSIISSGFAIALAIYQFIMIKKFIEEYYNK